MPTYNGKSQEIAQKLSSLRTLCDTGFALAIHIRYTRPTLLYQTYKQEWADHYSEMGYMISDPVVHWGLTNNGWVEWASLSDQDPNGVIADAVAHGLTHGWTYAVGPATGRTIAGVTRSEHPFTTADREVIRAIIDDIHAETEGFDTFPQDVQESLRNLPVT